jgi:hypothetical protein
MKARDEQDLVAAIEHAIHTHRALDVFAGGTRRG